MLELKEINLNKYEYVKFKLKNDFFDFKSSVIVIHEEETPFQDTKEFLEKHFFEENNINQGNEIILKFVIINLHNTRQILRTLFLIFLSYLGVITFVLNYFKKKNRYEMPLIYLNISIIFLQIFFYHLTYVWDWLIMSKLLEKIKNKDCRILLCNDIIPNLKQELIYTNKIEQNNNLFKYFLRLGINDYSAYLLIIETILLLCYIIT